MFWANIVNKKIKKIFWQWIPEKICPKKYQKIWPSLKRNVKKTTRSDLELCSYTTGLKLFKQVLILSSTATVGEVRHRKSADSNHSSSSSSRACPYWSVAVSTRCCQRPRSWAYLHAEFRPRLCGWRSDSSVRSQVRRGRPGRRLQSLGNPWMDDLSALLMSSEVSILARCPKKRSRLVRISWDNCGGEPALRRTVALLTWSVYGMRNIRTMEDDNGDCFQMHCGILSPVPTVHYEWLALLVTTWEEACN